MLWQRNVSQQLNFFAFEYVSSMEEAEEDGKAKPKEHIERDSEKDFRDFEIGDRIDAQDSQKQ